MSKTTMKMVNTHWVPSDDYEMMLLNFKFSHDPETGGDWQILHTMADWMEDQGKYLESQILHLMAVNQICPYQNDTWFRERDLGAWFGVDKLTAEGHRWSNVDQRILDKMDRNGVENHSPAFVEYMSYRRAFSEFLKVTIEVHAESNASLEELLPMRTDVIAEKIAKLKAQNEEGGESGQ